MPNKKQPPTITGFTLLDVLNSLLVKSYTTGEKPSEAYETMSVELTMSLGSLTGIMAKNELELQKLLIQISSEIETQAREVFAEKQKKGL